jgi:hypothetical protein
VSDPTGNRPGNDAKKKHDNPNVSLHWRCRGNESTQTQLRAGSLVTSGLLDETQADPKPKFAGTTGSEQTCPQITACLPDSRQL